MDMLAAYSESSDDEESNKNVSHNSHIVGNGHGEMSDQIQINSKNKGENEETSNVDDKLATRSAHGQMKEIYHSNRKRKLETETDNELGLPSTIKQMFGRNQQHHVDDPVLHSGRLRSFPHEQGNWATHVFVPVPRHNNLMMFVVSLIDLLLPDKFEILPEFHVSLSRTVVIRYHWIDPLMESLRLELCKLATSVCDIVDVKVYTNDEKTRTFVCLELLDEDKELTQYVTAVDKCFEGFKLAPYYQNPSFHISVAWCLGDVVSQISSNTLRKAKEMLTQFTVDNPDLSIVFARRVCCRSGNKSFSFSLKDSAVGS